MRATFPFQPAKVVLTNQKSVGLKVYTGEVLGAESTSVTHVSGTVINGSGSVTSEAISSGQIWLRAENGAKKSFVVADRLPFSPAVGHKVSIVTGMATGGEGSEANLAIHGHEYDATYWLAGDDFERVLTRVGLLGKAWSLMMVVYAGLIITIVGIPVALGIGIWLGSGRRRLFNDLKTKALAVLDSAVTPPSTV